MTPVAHPDPASSRTTHLDAITLALARMLARQHHAESAERSAAGKIVCHTPPRPHAADA